ncbi:hypothetical protein BGZ68_003077, partial [Mortierella alpina]
MRIDLSGEPSPRELLERVRRTTLGAYANQDLPFEQVVEIVQPPRRMDHTPLFQVMFAWQNNEDVDLNLTGLEVSSNEAEYDTAKFDLFLTLYEHNEGISGSLLFATSLFDRTTLERHVGHLCAMLQVMIADPERSVLAVDILSPEERKQLLEPGSYRGQDFPVDLCLHELFEHHADQRPDSTAVVLNNQPLSYADLNVRANRLAHHLINLGVQPGTLVAICVERSFAMIVGILAVLKAGGAYIPLDPGLPQDRLLTIVSDSSPVVLLADATGAHALGEILCESLVTLDPNVTLSNAKDFNPTVPGVRPENLSHIIYTSGTTGTPKGVMIEHRMVVRAFDAGAAWLNFDENDAWSMFHSYSFDISIWELWGALRYGGKLVLVPQNITRSPEHLYNLLCEQNVTVMNQTPSAFSMLIDYQKSKQYHDSLRYVMIGGEPLVPTMLQPWFAGREGLNTTIINMYGPSETFYTTYQPVHQESSNETTCPIGEPFPHLKLYILDGHRQPVPLGVVGELYVGGDGLARGYLNRKDMTAERFLPDPFVRTANARMYKTGDLVRYLANGNLMFVGRNDDQVKIHGFRVELGDIEAQLANHALVQEAVVTVVNMNKTKRLIAYVVAPPNEGLALALRSHLASRLPEYMMPAAFVRMDTFPLTRNGKLDKRALPEPGENDFARQAFEEPQGDVEVAVAAMWIELLRVKRVSRHDSFFALGGHSLLAVRLMNRISALGSNIPLSSLFAAPTLAAFATIVKDQLDQATN